jgi:hypothetical protein
LGTYRGGFHAVDQAAAAMRSLVPRVHAVELLVALVDGVHGAFDARLEAGAGDHHGDLDDAVDFGVQARHFAVEPHQVLVVLLEGRAACARGDFSHRGIVAEGSAPSGNA